MTFSVMNMTLLLKQIQDNCFFPKTDPNVKKKPYDQIDYIPEYVLEQLFANLNHLHPEVQPLVWIAFKTGLRISDVLGLTQDCLLRINGKVLRLKLILKRLL